MESPVASQPSFPLIDQSMVPSSSWTPIVDRSQPAAENFDDMTDEEEYEASVPVGYAHEEEEANEGEHLLEEDAAEFYSQVDIGSMRCYYLQRRC